MNIGLDRPDQAGPGLWSKLSHKQEDTHKKYLHRSEQSTHKKIKRKKREDIGKTNLISNGRCKMNGDDGEINGNYDEMNGGGRRR